MGAFASIATGNWSDVDTWRSVSAWAATTNYAVGNFVKPLASENGYVYEVTSDAGSSGGSEPTWPTTIGNTVVDDGITWTCRAGSPGQAAGDTVTIGDGVTATQNITLDGNPANSLASITNGDSTSYITVSAARTLTLTANPGLFSSANVPSAGFVRISAGVLTITHDQGAGTVAVQLGHAGYLIRTSGTGGLSVSNSGGTAINHTSGSYVLYTEGTGNVTITGTTINACAGNSTIRINSNCATTITGDIQTNANTSDTILLNGSSATLTLDGLPLVSTTVIDPQAIDIADGTVTWVGARTISAGQCAAIQHRGGTLALANAATALTVTCSGHLLIRSTAGTLTTTHATGGTASIVLQNNESSASIPGNKTTSIITMLNLEEGNVKDGVTIHGVEGTLAAGGGGLLRNPGMSGGIDA